jgi:uncharacterized repeat protein (TIGR01451 family)
MGKGESVTITIVTHVPASVPDGMVLENGAVASSDLFDPDNGNNLAFNYTHVSAWADLSVTKVQDPPVAVIGERIRYEVTVLNVGPSDAPRSAVSDILPSAISGAEWTCQAYGDATCPSATGVGSVEHAVNLPVHGRLVYEFQGTLGNGGAGLPISNTAEVSPAGGVSDSDLSNNADTAVNESLGLYLPLIISTSTAPLIW